MSFVRQEGKQAMLALLIATLFGCTTTPIPAYEDRDQSVSQKDLEILDRASDLLANESLWNRKDTRECPQTPRL